MKRSLALLALPALLLTGCVASVEPEPAPETSPPVETVEAVETETAEPSETEAPEAELVDRGFIHKEIGENGGLLSLVTNEQAVNFAITDIQRGFECTSGYASAPSNGQFVGLHFDVEVTQHFKPDEMMMSTFSIYEHDFQAFTADGKRVNDPVGEAFSCLSDSDRLPSDLGPGQSASGWVALDLPEDAVAVAFVLPDGLGWEWQLP